MPERAGSLVGKTALVTGGLSGIGAAVARAMVEAGATVVAADVSTDVTTLTDGPLRPHVIDVADPGSVAAAVDAIITRFGRLDCVVNCAGIGKGIMAVNLRGTFIVGQACARAMSANGGGAIVNVANVSGLTGNAGRSAYGASKGGVVILSRVMAVDLAQAGIRVNVIAPGPIETPLAAAMHTEPVRREWTERIPMHRYGTPDEIAEPAVFLCSDAARFITGQTLAIDGGFSGTALSES